MMLGEGEGPSTVRQYAWSAGAFPLSRDKPAGAHRYLLTPLAIKPILPRRRSSTMVCRDAAPRLKSRRPRFESPDRRKFHHPGTGRHGGAVPPRLVAGLAGAGTQLFG